MVGRQQFDVQIDEAGCLIYIADLALAGHGFGKFEELYSGSPEWKSVLEAGAVVMGSLYQDDGYHVRLVLGDLTEEEEAGWTSRLVAPFRLESGTVVLSGVCTPEFDDDMAEFPVLQGQRGEFELGCKIPLPPGDYRATFLGYPPNDLAGGWMRIEDPELFEESFGAKVKGKKESAEAYFKRTRPGVPVPDWVAEGYEDAAFLDFVVQLTPVDERVPEPRREEDGCVEWEYRKPDVCPVAIRL